MVRKVDKSPLPQFDSDEYDPEKMRELINVLESRLETVTSRVDALDDAGASDGDAMFYDGTDEEWSPRAIVPGDVTFRGCLLTKSSNQSIPNSTATALTWESKEEDTDDFHDVSTNNSRITIGSGISRVRLSSNLNWASNNSGVRDIFITKNGGGFAGAGRDRVSANGITPMNARSSVVSVSQGDYFEVEAIQTSGGSLDVVANNVTWFALEVIE